MIILHMCDFKEHVCINNSSSGALTPPSEPQKHGTSGSWLWPVSKVDSPCSIRPCPVTPEGTLPLWEEWCGSRAKGGKWDQTCDPSPLSTPPSWGEDGISIDKIVRCKCDPCLLRLLCIQRLPESPNCIRCRVAVTCFPPAGTFAVCVLTACSYNTQLWQHIDWIRMGKCQKKVLTFPLVQIINFLKE